MRMKGAYPFGGRVHDLPSDTNSLDKKIKNREHPVSRHNGAKNEMPPPLEKGWFDPIPFGNGLNQRSRETRMLKWREHYN